MGVSKMVSAASSGEVTLMEEASSEIEVAAKGGDPHARSVLGFLYNMGIGREINKAKAFMYHYFAANGGNMQSKMALAHFYARQDVSFYFLFSILGFYSCYSFLITANTELKLLLVRFL